MNFSVMIGSPQPKVLAEFYERVFGKPPDWTDGGWYGWQSGNNSLTIGEHSEVEGRAREPQRVILNFESEAVKEEFERLRGAGAEVVRAPYELGGGWIATFADPDGNYFQLVTPMNVEGE